MENLHGKWALITGASSGFGEEFARQYAAQGRPLVLVARRLEKLETLATELHEIYRVEIIVEQVDLSSVAAVIQRGRGKILLVASVLAYQGIEKFAVYAAAKAYVLRFGEALHRELKRDGVTVTVLCPGMSCQRILLSSAARTQHARSA